MARVGLIGATGLVGSEMLRLLAEREFPIDELRLYASDRSIGKRIAFADGQDHRWEVLVDASKVNSTTGFTLPKPPGVRT